MNQSYKSHWEARDVAQTVACLSNAHDTMDLVPRPSQTRHIPVIQDSEGEPEQQKLKVIFSYTEFETSLESWDPVSKTKRK